MGIKFQVDDYFKCRGDCCDFIKVVNVLLDTGKEAEVKAIWYTQMSKSWRQVSNETQFRISERNYPDWKVFKPRGELNEVR